LIDNQYQIDDKITFSGLSRQTHCHDLSSFTTKHCRCKVITNKYNKLFLQHLF